MKKLFKEENLRKIIVHFLALSTNISSAKSLKLVNRKKYCGKTFSTFKQNHQIKNYLAITIVTSRKN